jgi:hypothetical protein
MLPSEEHFDLSLLRKVRHLTEVGRLTWVHTTKDRLHYNVSTKSDETKTEHRFTTRLESGHEVRLEYEEGSIMLAWLAPDGWWSYSHLSGERYEEGNTVIEVAVSQLGLELVTTHREMLNHFEDLDKALKQYL